MSFASDFNLPVARFQVFYEAQTPVQFPACAGSTWRGAFGYALKQSVCVTQEPSCQACLLQNACVYSQVFETPARQASFLGKVDKAPHPYVLHPLNTSGQHYAVGDHLTIRLTLVGQALQHLAYFIHALQQLGQAGLGKGEGRVQLLRVEQEVGLGTGQWQTVYAQGGTAQTLTVAAPSIPQSPPQLRLQWQTPYRGVHRGQVMNAQQFQFQAWALGVLRRLSLLNACYTGEALALDFKMLQQVASVLSISAAEFYWYDWARYSNRQRHKVPMGGLLGECRLPTTGLEPFWPWLWWGQWLHVGKGAVMGMGEYRLLDAVADSSQVDEMGVDQQT